MHLSSLAQVLRTVHAPPKIDGSLPVYHMCLYKHMCKLVLHVCLADLGGLCAAAQYRPYRTLQSGRRPAMCVSTDQTWCNLSAPLDQTAASCWLLSLRRPAPPAQSVLPATASSASSAALRLTQASSAAQARSAADPLRVPHCARQLIRCLVCRTAGSMLRLAEWQNWRQCPTCS